MTVEPFASIEEMRGKVVAACGHRVDARTLVYWHCQHGVTALCSDCTQPEPNAVVVRTPGAE